MIYSFDPASIPTKDQVSETRNALADLELQLAAAERHVETIKQEIKARREWVAPMRRVPADILSLIFTIQSKVDWPAPRIIIQVCRTWRKIILATPRAWAFIHLPAADETMPHDAIDLWLTRCSSAPLDIGIPLPMHPSTSRALMKKSSSIESLSLLISLHDDYLGRNKFPNLVRLCFNYTYGNYLLHRDRTMATIDLSVFPRLRSLHLEADTDDYFKIASPTNDFPPLQELSVYIGRYTGSWINAIKGAVTSLRSLRLGLFGSHLEVISPITFQLPALRFLSIESHTLSTNPIPIKLVTPKLECYAEQSDSFSLHEDTRTVTELIILSNQIGNLASMPDLRRLSIAANTLGASQT